VLCRSVGWGKSEVAEARMRLVMLRFDLL
jgi:hypothetical protein